MLCYGTGSSGTSPEHVPDGGEKSPEVYPVVTVETFVLRVYEGTYHDWGNFLEGHWRAVFVEISPHQYSVGAIYLRSLAYLVFLDVIQPWRLPEQVEEIAVDGQQQQCDGEHYGGSPNCHPPVPRSSIQPCHEGLDP